ncbi:MAG TPA: sigma-70 family RNA polymerase sigma factor [Pyrinomonadaceae bacterium]|jgi:RNA polymerase sigma factor (sigma-70 family)|nr:sigma-70 family RNA polymerase sigma factor [Pyrinomonadaceae bacterium]
MEPTDQQLIAACRRGDQTAWQQIVNRYQRLIYTIPRRAGLDEDQAADVFQEVFTTLFEKLDRIEQPERLQAWLVTTARRKTWRVVVDSRNQRRRRGEDAGEEEMEAVPDDAPLAVDVLLSLEEQHRVRNAVSTLDERCQKLISLLFYSNEPPPYSEIAQKLGTSEGSIGPTRARCLEKLLKKLLN